jgi:hypothetical protein
VKSASRGGPHYVFFSSHLLPLRPKYLPQRPILKHVRAIFPSQYERPSATPMKTTGKIPYSVQ